MSIYVMSLVWRSALGDRTQADVLLYLANCADDEGGNCFPGIATIAWMSRISKRQVVRTIAKLEEGGWIRTLWSGDGRTHKSEYEVNVAKLKGCQLVTLSGRENLKKRVTSRTRKGDTVSRKGDKYDNPPHPLFGVSVSETSLEPSPPDPLAGEGEARHAVRRAPAPKNDARRARLARTAQASRARQRPLALSGSREPAAPHGGIESAVDQVASALGIANWRKRKLLRRVIELECEKGSPPPTVALAMIAAWHAQAQNSQTLKCKFGLTKFYGEGFWKDQNRWHWDEPLLRQRAQAKTGSLG